MVPIAKLPVEILVWIFRELRDLHVHTRSHRWLSVTHVCSSWRLVALEAAELWTQIYSLNPDCVQAFLTRSKCAPLSIFYTLGGRRDSRLDAVLPTVLSESSRFRRVELTHSGTAHTFLTHPFPGGAPLLTHLTLNYVFISELWTHAPTLETVTTLADVMPKISVHGLPALRRLHLEHWPVASLASIRGLLNSSLRSLAITQPHVRHSASAWADILKGLPLLEELTLICVLPLPGPEDIPSASKKQLPLIHLPRLSYLKALGDNPTDQLALLRSVVPSSIAHLIYMPNARTSRPGRLHIPFEQYTDILHAVSLKLTQKTLVTPRSLEMRLMTSSPMSAHTYRGLSVTLCTQAGNTDSDYCSRLPFDTDTPPALLLTLQGLDALHHDFATPLSDMLRTTFGWSTLHSLSLAPSHISTPVQDALEFAAFNDLFLQMTSLRVLSISSSYFGDCLLGLLGSFDAPAESEAEDGTGVAARVLFPALEVVSVKGRSHGKAAVYEPLCRALLSRKKAGYPTPRVHICPPEWRLLGRADPVDLVKKLQDLVVPLTLIGCSVDVCVEEAGEWTRKSFHLQSDGVSAWSGKEERENVFHNA